MITATDLAFAEVQVAPALAVQRNGHSAMDPASIKAAITEAFEAAMKFVKDNHLIMNGQPRVVYTAYDAGGMSFTAAIPVSGQAAVTVDEPPVFVATLPGGKAYRFIHHGPYEELGKTYNEITAFLKEKGWIETEADWAKYMPMWEEYMNDPETTPPADLMTHIYLPAVQ